MTAPILLSHQVNLFCVDLERCAEFYRAIGCPERFRTPAEGPPTHIEVTGPGGTIGITSARIGNDHFGLGVQVGPHATELVFWCEDSEVAYAAALAAGGTPVHPPVDSADGRLHHGWVLDPEGHQVKLVQHR